MEEYTIQYSNIRKLRIYRWPVLLWGLSYFFVFLMDYRSGTADWFSYVMLALSLIIVPISLFWFEEIMLNHPALTLSDSRIEHKEGKIFAKKRIFGWADVDAIRIVGDIMELKLTDGGKASLSLPSLLYEERKKMKERLAEIAEEKGVGFSSAF